MLLPHLLQLIRRVLHLGKGLVSRFLMRWDIFLSPVSESNAEFVSHFSRPALHLSLRRSRGPSHHRNSTPFPTDFNGNPLNQQHTSHPLLPQFPSGSLPYASPEMLSPPNIPRSAASCKIHGTPFAPNPAQDMWALGVLLYALLTGKLPFADSFEPRLQMKILHGAFLIIFTSWLFHC